MKCVDVKVIALVCALLVCDSIRSSAGVIKQRPGDDSLLFEAEDFDLLIPEGPTEGFQLVTVDDPLEVGLYHGPIPLSGLEEKIVTFWDLTGLSPVSLTSPNHRATVPPCRWQQSCERSHDDAPMVFE